jgi:acyl carrier protein
MEAVIRQRRAEGLPGLALGWSAIMDVGYLSREQETAKLIRRIGGNVEFTSRQALRTQELVMAQDQNISGEDVLWVTPMAWSGTINSLPVLKSPTFKVLQDLGETGATSVEGDDLREMLWALSPEKGKQQLVEYLLTELSRILRVPAGSISPTAPVAEVGVDSLMGVELGLAAQKSLGDDLPLMTINDQSSIESIAEKMITHIHGSASDGKHAAGMIGELAAEHIDAKGVSSQSVTSIQAAE